MSVCYRLRYTGDSSDKIEILGEFMETLDDINKNLIITNKGDQLEYLYLIREDEIGFNRFDTTLISPDQVEITGDISCWGDISYSPRNLSKKQVPKLDEYFD